jgi:calcineurin-like phosphoesterase family protein
MVDTWVISDTHFNHKNILNFKDDNGNPVRSFSSVEEMNETMIERWNEYVKPGDKIYHLGDVFFGHMKWVDNNWTRLKGRKRLVVGNHDHIQIIVKTGMFERVQMWHILDEHNLLLTHVPVSHQTSFHDRVKCGKKPLTNVHGHIHANLSPIGRYVNVCVEATDYRPIHIDELAKLAKIEDDEALQSEIRLYYGIYN